MFNLYAIHSTYYIQEVQVIVEHILFQSLDRKFSRGLDFVRRIVTIPGSVTQGSSTIVMVGEELLFVRDGYIVLITF